MLVVKSKIEDGRRVVSKAADRLVSSTHVINNAGGVRRSCY
jgi:hypothetical protein